MFGGLSLKFLYFHAILICSKKRRPGNIENPGVSDVCIKEQYRQKEKDTLLRVFFFLETKRAFGA